VAAPAQESGGSGLVWLLAGLLVLIPLGLCVVAGVGFAFWRYATLRPADSARDSTPSASAPTAADPWFDPSVAAIETVMAKSNQVLADAEGYVEQGTLPVDAVAWTAGQLRAIDTSACPGDFRESFLRYVQSYDALTQQLRNEPRDEGEAFVMGLLKGLQGQSDGGLGELVEGRQQRVADVQRAWNEVEAAAVRHGARY
jgi:hypothetical protein